MPALPKPDTGAGSQAGSQTPMGPAPVTPYSSLWDLFQGAQAGQQAGQQSQQDLLSQQLGMTGANFATQSGYINQDMQNQLARLGLQSGSQGIQQGALNRQQQLLPQQYALQQQQYGIQGAGLDAAAQQAQQQADVQKRGAGSSAAARGAVNTSGYGQQLTDIGTQLQNSLSGIDRSRQSLDVSKQQSALSNTEQQAQLGDQQKNLDLLSKGMGLSSNEIHQRAQQALDQLGLSSAMSVNDITQAMVDSATGQFNPLQTILGMVYQLSGLKPPTGG